MTIIYDCEQGSEEWYQARMGIPTASEFSTVLAKPQKDNRYSKTRRTYLLKLAGERLTGLPMESYTNAYMERGKLIEPEARSLYQFSRDVELQQVGFIRNETMGCSPDALIGEDGGVEFKSALRHILIEHILKDIFPAEHYAQCQGGMLVSGRKWWDLAIYSPGLPLFVKRAERDDDYCAMLQKEIDQFNAELDFTVDLVNRYGRPIKADLEASLT